MEKNSRSASHMNPIKSKKGKNQGTNDVILLCGSSNGNLDYIKETEEGRKKTNSI